MILILSCVQGSVTNNKFWIGWLDLLTPYFTITPNHNQCLPKTRSILAGLRLSSLLVFLLLWLTLFWFTNHSLLLYEWIPNDERMNHEAPLLYDWIRSQSESYVTTDGQSASLSWNKALIWGLRPDFYYCQAVTGLLMWGALSDERTGLSFTSAAGPRQRSYSRVRVPWPYFTVSDSRLPFSPPPTTRRAMVEVFDPTSTRG
jgi:hypothetical protein